MQIPQNALVAVVDGEKLALFTNRGTPDAPDLKPEAAGDISTTNRSGGMGHSDNAANPDGGQQEEDGFAAGVVEMLNARARSGKLDKLIVIAAPRTLGEMRKHYHAKLKDALVGELSKDLTGQTSEDIAKAIASA